MTHDPEEAKRRIAELERMRAEFGPEAPASISGFIDHELQKLQAELPHHNEPPHSTYR